MQAVRAHTWDWISSAVAPLAIISPAEYFSSVPCSQVVGASFCFSVHFVRTGTTSSVAYPGGSRGC